MKSIIASNHFLKFKKHAHNNFQLEIDSQVKIISLNPELGEIKKGDLEGIRILKFKFNNQLYLLSYEVKNDVLYLYSIGSHENFYKKLKTYLKG